MFFTGALRSPNLASAAAVTSLVLVLSAGGLYWFQTTPASRAVGFTIEELYRPVEYTGGFGPRVSSKGPGDMAREPVVVDGALVGETEPAASGSAVTSTETNVDQGIKSAPNVDECNMCFSCRTAQFSQAEWEVRKGIAQNQTNLSLVVQSQDLGSLPENTSFRMFRTTDRSSSKNCTECYGCSRILAPIEEPVIMLGQSYSMERGASPVWVFRVEDDHEKQLEHNNGVVVKIWCIPLPKRPKDIFKPCSPRKEIANVQARIAIQHLVHECGFEDVVKKSWIEPVNALVPGTGYVVDWEGVFSEKAPGVSLESFLSRNRMQQVLEMMKKVNSSQVVQSALFDLLTSQCDRHAQNVFIDENGRVTLIDNDQSLGKSWQACGVDSLFLPTTEKYAINQVGHAYAFQRTPESKPSRLPSIQLMLDYRCHIPGGKIGLDYPPRLRKCMQRISKLTEEDLALEFNLTEASMARALQARAKSMLDKGFEWALEFGSPLKPAAKQYQWYQPCCNFSLEGKCLNEWHLDTRLPPFEENDGRSLTSKTIFHRSLVQRDRQLVF